MLSYHLRDHLRRLGRQMMGSIGNEVVPPHRQFCRDLSSQRKWGGPIDRAGQDIERRADAIEQVAYTTTRKDGGVTRLHQRSDESHVGRECVSKCRAM